MSALSDIEDAPPMQREPRAALRESDTEPANLRPPHVPEEFDRPSRQSLLEALTGIRGALTSIEGKLTTSQSEQEKARTTLGKLTDVVTRIALAQARAAGIMKNGLEGKRLLIVDDDRALCRMLCRVARDLGCETEAASTREQAEAILQENYEEPFDLAIIDLRIPDAQDGIELGTWIGHAYPSTAMLVVSADLNVPGIDRLRAARLEKPFDLDVLRAAIYDACGVACADTERPGAYPELTPPSIILSPAVLAGAFPPHDLATEPSPPPAAYESAPVSPHPWNDDDPDTANETPDAKRSEPPPKPSG